MPLHRDRRVAQDGANSVPIAMAAVDPRAVKDVVMEAAPSEASDTGSSPPGNSPSSGSRWLRAAPLLVLAAACVSAFPGLEQRDMTGDEWGHLGQSMVQMLDRSIESNNPDQFSAHMPLAWMARHVLHSVFGDDSIVVWRLHSALGCCIAALLAWWALWRRREPGLALAVGLLVAVNPLLSFHAHDSTNYSLGPLTGVLLLVGMSDLADGRRSALWSFPLALFLGTVNDYFFTFLSITALLLSPLLIRMAPDPRVAGKRLLLIWAGIAAIFAVPAVIFFKRLQEVPFSQLVYRHANAAEVPMDAWQTISTGLADFTLAYVQGYGAAVRHQFDPWVNLGPLVLVLAAVVFSLRSRDSLARIAAWVIAITVANILVVDYVFGQVVWDAAGEDGPTVRDFPNFPRTYIALMPALVITWVVLLKSWGRRFGLALIVALLLVQSVAMLRHITSVSNTRAWAVERIEELWQPGDLVMSCLGIKHRLDERIPLVSERRLCLPDTLEIPHRIWMVSFPGGWEADRVALCWNQDYKLLENGYRVRLSEDRFLPPHDEGTNSFLQSGVRVIMLERSPAPEAPGNGEPWKVFFEPSFLSGGPGSSAIATWFEQGDAADVNRPFAREVELGRNTGVARDFSLILHPPALPGWLMRKAGGLFRAYEEPVALWPQMPLPPDPILTTLSLRTYALAAPWLSVLVRGLTALLGLAAALALVVVPLRRRRAAQEQV